MYPAPVTPEPPPPPNPLVDAGLRYRQVLGAYHRSEVPPAVDPRSKRGAYVRVADRSRQHHDGLYFRFAMGIGFAHDAAQSNRPLPSLRQFSFEAVPLDGSGGGMAAVTEIAIGYTPGAGIALGVGIYTATIPSLTLDVKDPRTGTYVYRVSQLAIIGPVVDWYFFPDAGFHAQASPGVATYVAGAAEPSLDGPQAQAHTAVGFGFMLGVGYEWWVGDEWGVGILGRISYGSMSGSDDRNVSWTHTSYAPAILLSATYD
jgi:hypothetical protein